MSEKFSIFVLMCLSMLVTPMIVVASEVPFSVEPKLGEKQNKEVVDYFDMTLDPEEEVIVQVSITNNSKDKSQYEVILENAFTNENGLIDFQTEEMKNGSIPDFTSISDAPQLVNVPANTTINHSINIKMPKEAYGGVLLGGIRVRELSREDSNAQVTNTYSYVIPIKLHQGKQGYPDTLTYNHLKLDTSHPLQTRLKLALTNPQPDVLRKINLSVKIKLKDVKVPEWEVLIDKEIQMAPITSTSFSMYIDRPLEKGTYLVKIKGQTTTFEQEWEDEFVIDSKTEKEIKSQVSSEEKNPINWLVVILLVIVCVQTLIFINYRRKKKYEKV